MKKWAIVLSVILVFVTLFGLGYVKQFTAARAKSDLEIRYYPQTFNVTERLKSDDYYVLYKAQLVSDPNVVFKVGVRKLRKGIPWHVQTTDDYVAVTKDMLIKKVLQDKTFIIQSRSDIDNVSEQVYETMKELNAWLDVYCIETHRFSPSCTLPVSINETVQDIEFYVMSKDEIKKTLVRAFRSAKSP